MDGGFRMTSPKELIKQAEKGCGKRMAPWTDDNCGEGGYYCSECYNKLKGMKQMRDAIIKEIYNAPEKDHVGEYLLKQLLDQNGNKELKQEIEE